MALSLPAALLGGSVINSLGSFVGSQIGLGQQKNMLDYQMQNYYSPEAQVKSMTKAGINPAAVLSQNGMQTLGSADSNVSAVPNIGISGLGEIAQATQALANAKKAGADTVGQELENQLKRATMDENIRAAALRNGYTKEQTANVIQHTALLVGQANDLMLSNEIKKIDLEKHRELLNSQLREYADKHNLSKQQFDALSDQLPVVLEKLKAERDIINIDADIARDFKDTNAKLGVLGDALKVLTQMFRLFK